MPSFGLGTGVCVQVQAMSCFRGAGFDYGVFQVGRRSECVQFRLGLEPSEMAIPSHTFEGDNLKPENPKPLNSKLLLLAFYAVYYDYSS